MGINKVSVIFKTCFVFGLITFIPWVLDVLYGNLTFSQPYNFAFDALFQNISANELFFRVLIVLIFIFFGIVSGIFKYRYLHANLELQENHEELSQIYEELSASEEELRVQNEELQHQRDQLTISRKELENQKAFFEQMFLQSATSTQILSPEGWCIKINGKMAELFGVLPEHIEGRVYNIFEDSEIIKTGTIDHLRKVFDHKEVADWDVFFDIANAAASQNIEISGNKKAWFRCRSYPVMNSDGSLAFAVIQHEDITGQKMKESQLFELSYHDKLTGLYNRAFLEEALRRFNTSGQHPISLILGDVNGLKLTNDVFGHKEGDRLLQKIAGFMKEACGTDFLASRWGGDEFAIILPGTTGKEAQEICRQIYKLCSAAGMDPIQPSLAMGISTKDSPEKSIFTVLKEAEDRMYRHKLLESKSVRNSIIASLEKTLFERSFETKEHAHRMTETALRIGQAIGLSQSEQDELKLLSWLHDIGKIAIPDGILTKPGKLTPAEWEEMKKHPEIGYRIAQSTQELSHIADFILAHHEKWDGSGYPQGLKGNEIPRLSRILAIVDAYDVMTHSRPYKKAIRREDALVEIARCSGIQFDPEIVDIFLQLV